MSAAIGFTGRPVLTGELVVLRPLADTDLADILATLADAQTSRLTATHATISPERVRAALADRSARTDRIDMAVIERAGGRYAGQVVLHHLDPDNGSCGLRIALATPFTGRGLGSEATALILAHAFDTVGVHRVELEVSASHPRARHVYEKAGFVYEGTRRQALRWQHEWVDTYVMGILADDWAARRAWQALPRSAEAPTATTPTEATSAAAPQRGQSGSVTKSINRSTAPSSGVSRSR